MTPISSLLVMVLLLKEFSPFPSPAEPVVTHVVSLMTCSVFCILTTLVLVLAKENPSLDQCTELAASLWRYIRLDEICDGGDERVADSLNRHRRLLALLTNIDTGYETVLLCWLSPAGDCKLDIGGRDRTRLLLSNDGNLRLAT